MIYIHDPHELSKVPLAFSKGARRFVEVVAIHAQVEPEAIRKLGD